LLLVVILAASCGGGGSGSSQSSSPVAPAPPPPAQPAPLPTIDPSVTGPLTTNRIDNLAVLARVWGFLKYHHPKIAGGQLDWDRELIEALPAILDAADASARNDALLTWLQGVGEPAVCSPCAAPPVDPYFEADIAWIHDTALLGGPVSAYLERVYANRFAGGNQFYVSKGGVANAVLDNEATYAALTLPNGGFRLLALFRLWNVIEYLYPYRDIIGEPWEDVLSSSIASFYEAASRDDYARALLRVFARINDTHANLWNGLATVLPPQGTCWLPVLVRFIEGQVTVVAYGNAQLGPASGLEIGDVLTAIDGTPVQSLIDDWTPYYPASNQPTRLRDIAHFITRGACQSIDLQILRGQNTLAFTVERIPSADMNPQIQRTHDHPGPTFQLLAPDIAYLKLSSVTQADAAQYVTDAQGTAGLVIDIRNYPSEFVVFALGEHLVSQPVAFARFTIPDLTNPGAFVWQPNVITLQPTLPHYAGKVAILVDEATQSQAEYSTMAFRVAPDAVVIGSTTAGADGNVSEIPLPGDMGGLMTGIGAFYPDKSPTQRIGIIPDIAVTPTIAGIRDGRDELLDRAVDWIRGVTP
jgi:Peptidase family S41